jgi:FkbM family methyltransferase
MPPLDLAMLRRVRLAAKEGLLATWPSAFWVYMGLRHGDAGLEPELDLLPALCDRAAAGLDVGANYGLYTHFMRRHCARTWAFEPNPRLAAILRRQHRRHPDVSVLQLALSDRAGEAALRVPRGRPGRGTVEDENPLTADLDGVPIEALEVRRSPLDQLGLPRVGFIKIDVEGHELEVLQGGQELIRRDLPALLIEVEERHRSGSIAGVAALLEPLGYRPHRFCGGRLRDPGDSELAAGSAAGHARNFLYLQEAQAARVVAFSA